MLELPSAGREGGHPLGKQRPSELRGSGADAVATVPTARPELRRRRSQVMPEMPICAARRRANRFGLGS